MSTKKLFIISWVLILSAICVTAQNSQPASDADDYSTPATPRSTLIKDRGLGLDMLPYELTRSAEKLVSVTDSEKAKFANLRKSSGMKMLKIFSAPECASAKLVIDVSRDECTAAVDFIRASFYSFRFSLYGETIVDFRILEDRMIAGNGGFVHGLIRDLGKLDVTTVDLKSNPASSFFDMPIASTLEEETKQRARLLEGLEFEGATVSSTKKLIEGNSYLVRIVSYNFKQGDRTTFDRDQLYLVKYIGMNAERVALILWKKLADRAAPKL